MSSIAQALAEKDRALHGKGGEFFSKVVCTGKQERTANCPRKKSGTDLWRLQLGAVVATSTSSGSHAVVKLDGPHSDWEEHGAPDWLYNRERRLFYAVNTGKLFWFDQAANRHWEFFEGRKHDFAIRAEGSAHAGGGRQGKHVVIADLHEAAAALKIDLSHIDRPAAYFATFGCNEKAAPTDAAAKSVHMYLLPRLAEYRGAWSDERLQASLKASFEHVAKGFEAAQGIDAVVALVLGDRLVAASSYAARGFVVDEKATRREAHGRPRRIVDFGDPGGQSSVPATLCVRLEEDANRAIVLVCEEGRLSNEEAAESVVPWVERGQCRAACVALLGCARRSGAVGSLVALVSRLRWDSATGGAKRMRTEQGNQVRCRHILVRHAASRQPFDKVRKKAVKRSLEDAERLQLSVLTTLEGVPTSVDSGAAPSSVTTDHALTSFTGQCRAVSECDTSLKGGELAGDLGWLDVGKRHERAPAPIPKVAMALQVGQVSDLVATELGIHILKRTA